MNDALDRGAAGQTADVDALVARFDDRSARIGVIGLGYVGLPLARTIAERGFTVLGFDLDPAKVARLNAGQSYIRHISSESIAAGDSQAGFRPSIATEACRSTRSMALSTASSGWRKSTVKNTRPGIVLREFGLT